jgi:hypothetical protein
VKLRSAVSIQILDSLLCEHDEAPHVWHLMALAHYAGADFDDADGALQHGEKLLQQAGRPQDQETAGLFHELRERIQEGKALEKTSEESMNIDATA